MQDGSDSQRLDSDAVFAADADRPVRIDDPFARQLLTRYLARRENDLVSLRNAVNDGEYELIERTGHNLYGSGSAYGLDVVSTLGACLEVAARRQRADRILELIDELENFLRHLKIA